MKSNPRFHVYHKQAGAPGEIALRTDSGLDALDYARTLATYETTTAALVISARTGATVYDAHA